MKKMTFHVEFKSDIVLPATSNTEGNIVQLDFIPGSNFLGMVARQYDAFNNSFDVFHSGKVRFGDATLLAEGKELYKMPFSLYHPKLNEDEVYHHHFLTDEQRKELGQLKQMRHGYISPNLDNGLAVTYLEYNYAQKSAHDRTKRRSKTGSMYGYKAIVAGIQWQFAVQYDPLINSDDIALLKKTLTESTRLGKSKSAQYGQIEIRYISDGDDVVNSVRNNTQDDEEVIIYAKSRIALVDEEGHATYDLKYLIGGLNDENIVHEKSQIRIAAFTPYNGAMQTKTYERPIIEKGSVFVLKGLNKSQHETLHEGAGIYLSEGFGELLINPSFLTVQGKIAREIEEKAYTKIDQKKRIESSPDDATVQFLINRHNHEINTLTLADDVAAFIKDDLAYRDIKNAQWGTIRSICTARGKDFREKIREYLSSGKAAWREDQINRLLDDTHSLEFIKLVAMQMPKQKGGES